MELLEPAGSPTAARKSPLNLKKEIGRYLKKWPWILLSILLFYIAAKVYLRYTTDIFLTKSSVKIENLEKGSLGAIQNMGSVPMMAKQGAGVEIPIILSRPILYDVVKTLNTDVLYKVKGQVKDQELYREAPVDIRILSLKEGYHFAGRTYTYIDKGNASFELKGGDGKVHRLPYNTVCTLDFGTFIVKPKAGFRSKEPMEVHFMNAVKVAEGLQSSIIIAENELNTEILELSHRSQVPDKSEATLNTLVMQYNKADLENKREQSKVSLAFIDERLEVLTQDLGSIENQKEGFKRQNQITDLESQAQMSLQNANENTKALLEQATQLEMVNSVLNVANRSSREQLLPAGVGLPGGVDQAITQYNDLVIARNRTLRQATPANPAIQEFNKEIASLKSLIQDNLVKSRQSIQMNISRLNGQLNESKSDISKFPTQEKVFRNIDRQQNLKESLYLYLLQKKEETSIAMAVTMPKVRVVNPAYTQAGPVEPKRQQIMLGSLAAGLVLPLLVFFVLFTFDTQVKSKNDITEALPDLPVLAEVPTVGKNESDLIGKNDLSVYAEAFRILTSNLKFMLNKQQTAPVILFTSSVKGEGKTTVSVNSALALASNKKVLLIGADLRNPQLGRYIPQKMLGLSDYLAQDDSVDFRTYIKPSSLHDNLDIMQSGSIPPNPTDLLEDHKMGSLLDQLRAFYDYILIDSAPMMMVSDTFHLLRSADVVVYVVRANYTEKELLTYAGSVAEDENVSKMAIVLNDVHKNEMRYGYGGKYSYGYEADHSNNSWWTNLKSRL
ncbi:polysaccharide biosynthesis tyrosine autokinase [Chryseobacterium sp. cx-311]|uniref:GumC family protein n=1 Tax=Marnyiella aurantia TaxID=2758037 RepID=UPI001AEA79C5|nr:polysaccharide biosynthesis tyrosine autokinase [Marnyiella aurantia]MBP0612935.1 polysaccharide biosynthesis tyrosine autokinase [Marnyiella aurantia]